MTKTCKSKEVSKEISLELKNYLSPLLEQMDSLMDKRLVRTFFGLIQSIMRFRHSSNGLLLSELGGYLLSPDQAPAGTKRISNLLRSQKWTHKIVEQFLWIQAALKLDALEKQEDKALILWDESVWEKPESIALEGLGAVRSSQAARLKRIKKGFYNPPGRPIFVPGMNWLGVVLVGMKEKPCLVSLKWWSTRGKFASHKRVEQSSLLNKLICTWGKRVLHIFDRGYAGEPWLIELRRTNARFVLRWPKTYKLLNTQGENKKAWEISRAKRSLDHRMIRDTKRNCKRKVGLYYTKVHHAAYPLGLSLIVSRQGKGRHPWYLLTNESVESLEAAWQIIFSYSRRWQIETAWRFSKSELAFETPRLWKLENRLKLLFIATLVFAFLLLFLNLSKAELKKWLLRFFCHRTGKKCRTAAAPLYRIRSALSRLWLEFPPPTLLI